MDSKQPSVLEYNREQEQVMSCTDDAVDERKRKSVSGSSDCLESTRCTMRAT